MICVHSTLYLYPAIFDSLSKIGTKTQNRIRWIKLFVQIYANIRCIDGKAILYPVAMYRRLARGSGLFALVFECQQSGPMCFQRTESVVVKRNGFDGLEFLVDWFQDSRRFINR